MIRKIVQWFKKFDEWDKNLTRKLVEDTFQLETFRQFFKVIFLPTIALLFAWNAHIIGPYIDSVLGTGPHDIDSYGKIVWRRIYSSALCGPMIAYAIVRFSYNLWKRYRK